MRIFTFVLALALSFSLAGQNLQQTANGPREDGNIEEQIDFLVKESNNYKDYKVIPKVKMQKLKANILDSLGVVRSRLRETNTRLSEKNTTIQSLNSKLEDLQKNLEQTEQEKDSISFLGMDMGKGAFKTLFGLIVAGLAGLLGFFIFRFRDSNVVTKETKKALASLQVEFEDHRKRSLEREQKAMRRLQDEINKKSGV